MKKLLLILTLLIISSGLLLSQNTWQGGHAQGPTDWFVKQNWSLNTVPVAGDIVVIPSGRSAYPVLTAAGAVCNNLTVQAGATLAMGNFTLNVANNATISGTISYGTGRMVVVNTLTRNNISGTGIRHLFSANNFINIINGGINSIIIKEYPNTTPPNVPGYDPSYAVNRYYEVMDVLGGGTATLRFDYLLSEKGTSLAPEFGKVWRYMGSEIGWMNDLTQGLAANYYTEFLDEFGASDLKKIYAIAGDEGALPVQLASFTGQFVSNTSVELEWMTISETKNYGFYVEKFDASVNDFVTISSSFRPGAGTTLTPQHYNWNDDDAVNPSEEYRLKQVDTDGLIHYSNSIVVTKNPTGVRDGETAPAVFALNQNYPNPFNPSTKISFSLVKDGYTTLKVYNLIGREVATLFSGNAEAGRMFVVNFDASSLNSGVYFYKLQNGSNTEVKKLTLMK